MRHYSHVGITQCVSLLQKMIHDVLYRLQKFYKIKHAAISSNGMKRVLWRETLGFEHSKNTWYSSPIILMAHMPQNLRSLPIPAYYPASISNLWLQHLNFTIFLQTFRGSLSKYASSSSLFLRFLYKMHLVLASIVLDHSCLNWSWSLVFKSSLVASMSQLIPCWTQISPKPLSSNIVRTQLSHSGWKQPSRCMLNSNPYNFLQILFPLDDVNFNQ